MLSDSSFADMPGRGRRLPPGRGCPSLDPASRAPVDRTGGETTAWQPFSPYVTCVWLWCGHCKDLSGLRQWEPGAWRRGGLTWAWVGEAWPSQLLLVAVEGLDQRPWSLGVTYGPMGARPPAAVLPAPACSGMVLQSPTLHSVLPQALGSHQPLGSQVPLLAKGRQLLAR